MRILFLLGLLFVPVLSKAQSTVAAIPKPASITPARGLFTFQPSTKIVLLPQNERSREIARFLQGWLKKQLNLSIQIQNSRKIPPKAIVLALERHDDITHTEGYELRVSNDQIRISAAAPAGLFWGVQTLRQLFPPEVEGANPLKKTQWSLAAVTIRDAPRFDWRGSLLDVGRHFYSVEFVKRYIDLLSVYKMNVFHWHLTEDQGWRMEIKKYPKLTEVGAWRTEADGTRRGGFYTQAQIKEVIAYARLRNITVVPEIEMPGHASAALTAYPQYSCSGETKQVPHTWGVFNDIYCVAKPETMAFIKDVLDEVIALFPSHYIHIGGDEAPKAAWKDSELTQQFMREKGISNEAVLQSWFIKEIDTYLQSKGRKLIGWDEILEGGLAAGATVQAWRDIEHAKTTAQLGNFVISSPTSHAYFDYPADITPLQQVYSFNPIPQGLTNEEAKRILGGEANIWTERITEANFDVMVFPRLLAMAEALWTQGEKSFADFEGRLDQTQAVRLKRMGVALGPKNTPLFVISPRYLPEKQALGFDVAIHAEALRLHYTTDGSAPSLKSPIYDADLSFNQPAKVQLQPYLNGKPLLQNINFAILPAHLGLGKSISYVKQPARKYAGTGMTTLIDAVEGSFNFHDRLWHGWNDDDLDASLDLGTVQSVNQIALSTLQASNDWILLPKEVQVWVSTDQKTWQDLGKITHAVPAKRADSFRHIFSTQLSSSVSARYIRVLATRQSLPDWHNGAGTPAWIFADELIVH